MRVLILEDDPELAEQIASMLRDENHAVDVIGDGEEGLSYGLENSYDAVILDPGLPTIDGISVLRRWRESGLTMPVIVLNTSGAVRNTSVSIIEMGQSFLGTRRDIILKIIMPSASPIIFAGLRLGVSAGFIGAILSELKITPTGVGDIITYSRSIADYPSMYAAIFSIILLAVLFLNVLERIEVVLFKGVSKELVSD